MQTPPEENCILLGDRFEPGHWDVICGRGKHSYNHIGNRRFRIRIAIKFRDYVHANTSKIKWDIIDQIHHDVEETSSYGCGFVKQNHANKIWYGLPTSIAQQKIYHTFRDYMKDPKLHRRLSKCTPEEKEIAIDEVITEIMRSCNLIECDMC